MSRGLTSEQRHKKATKEHKDHKCLMIGRASRYRRAVREMVFARIRGGDDHADRFLVKSFETAVALKILEVAA
jgi:hypothetical protein